VPAIIVSTEAEVILTAGELREAREGMGLTQAAVSDALGVELRTYRRWESGESPVPPWLTLEAAVMTLRLLIQRGR
jgi:transcriptional regulator with XRE-family HTH domain